MFLVYKTDAWHSYASRDLIGVGNTILSAIALCIQQSKKEGKKISSEQLWNLENLKQTQGYDWEEEFDIEEVQTNTLL
ncbi:MAG: hypothetical protein GX963_09140 [Bacteroidales bacterium]|nr:hypothetical protein [Bacteroidales bacterium]